ncbi:MAG: hypothetical protein Q9174_005783 [Haloplaca sp. 1 TL-2023]
MAEMSNKKPAEAPPAERSPETPSVTIDKTVGGDGRQSETLGDPKTPVGSAGVHGLGQPAHPASHLPLESEPPSSLPSLEADQSDSIDDDGGGVMLASFPPAAEQDDSPQPRPSGDQPTDHAVYDDQPFEQGMYYYQIYIIATSGRLRFWYFTGGPFEDLQTANDRARQEEDSQYFFIDRTMWNLQYERPGANRELRRFRASEFAHVSSYVWLEGAWDPDFDQLHVNPNLDVGGGVNDQANGVHDEQEAGIVGTMAPTA